jgi:hypothetical protein
MAVDLSPSLWFDKGGTDPIVTDGAEHVGYIQIFSGDGTNGIDGLDLDGTSSDYDGDNAARILKPILENAFQYQSGLDPADVPTTMFVSRSVYSGANNQIEMTYSVKFVVDASQTEVADEV